jgi:hypothetical protein
MALFRSRYGDTPLHLLAVVASFAIAGYALFRIVESPSALGTLIWLGAAAIAHDLIAFPLYSCLNLIAHRTIGGRADAREEERLVPLINHIRIPAALSALALLLFFPLILGLDSTNYEKDAGLGSGVFLGRWLGLCAALFLGSALIYAIRLRRASPPGDQGDEDEGPDDEAGPPPEEAVDA